MGSWDKEDSVGESNVAITRNHARYDLVPPVNSTSRSSLSPFQLSTRHLEVGRSGEKMLE